MAARITVSPGGNQAGEPRRPPPVDAGRCRSRRSNRGTLQGVTRDRPRDDRAAPQRPAASDKPSTASPFARLAALRSSLPAGPAGPDQPASPAADARPGGPARAVVRMERKGRGGKEVTVVDKLGLGPAALEAWCRDLKQALGCGGSVDG